VAPVAPLVSMRALLAVQTSSQGDEGTPVTGMLHPRCPIGCVGTYVQWQNFSSVCEPCCHPKPVVIEPPSSPSFPVARVPGAGRGACCRRAVPGCGFTAFHGCPTASPMGGSWIWSQIPARKNFTVGRLVPGWMVPGRCKARLAFEPGAGRCRLIRTTVIPIAPA